MVRGQALCAPPTQVSRQIGALERLEPRGSIGLCEGNGGRQTVVVGLEHIGKSGTEYGGVVWKTLKYIRTSIQDKPNFLRLW